MKVELNTNELRIEEKSCLEYLFYFEISFNVL